MEKLYGAIAGGTIVAIIFGIAIIVCSQPSSPAKAEATAPEVETNSGWTREIIKLGTGMNSEWVIVLTSPDGVRFVHGNSNITLTPYPKVTK